MSSRAFVATVLGLASIAFLAVAALNFCVNPYAQYPTNIVEPLVQTSRAQKIALLSQHAAAPDGLLVGSSRILKYEPEYLQTRLGHTFFNAGVNYGKPEDHLAFVRFYENKFGCLPKTLIVGLDVHGFNDNLPTDARLLNNRELVCRIPDAVPFTDRFQSVKELLSWQQTMSSIRSLKRTSDESTDDTPSESFQDDGLIVYHDREQQIAEGRYDFAAALDYSKREYKQLFAGYDKLSEKRLQLFLETVNTCRAAGSQVTVLLTPMHPELSAYLADSTTYQERHADLVHFLTEQSQSHVGNKGFGFFDLTDIATFGGSPEPFVDGIHPLEANTRRIIDRLFAASAKESQYAIQ